MPIRPLLFAAFVVPALALAAGAVPLPRERPAPQAASSSVPLPLERPGRIDVSSSAPAPEPSASSEASSSSQAASSSSGEPRPPRDYQVACPAVMNGEVTARAMPPIHDGQCGIQSPLALTAITANGRSIPLNAAVTTDCGMATALPGWIGDVDSYLKAHDNTEIKSIDVSTSYDCRNVDHARAGNLSFHAFADALDLMGFVLADGRTVSIDPGFNGTAAEGRDILHFARDSACTHFMTVLGPDADSFHQNNIHLDLACHGKLCTARLCE